MALVLRLCRVTSLLLCFCMLLDSVALGAKPLDPASVRQQLQSHGVGSVVRLTRKGGDDLKGSIVSIGEDECVLATGKQHTPVTVAYTDVTKVRGPGLSHGARVGITVGVCVVAAVAITAAVLAAKFKSSFPKTIPI